ncbi:MAG: DUF192 domain-containing protein [Patescibacteria group bacterium]|jgi:hypothetical protein
MSKKLFVASLSFAGLIMACVFVVALWPSQGTRQVDVKGTKFSVQVATTALDREKGLSGQPELKDDQGMLFKFDQPDKQTFWMKGMLFPLDIIFIRDGKIVDMALDMPTPQPGANLPAHTSKETVDRVLEVNAGTAHKLGWEIGTRVISP